jgi:asparagine synthase (glutamine-hydrolysing)
MIRAGRAAMKLHQYLENGEFSEHPYLLQRMHFFPRQIRELVRTGEALPEADHFATQRLHSLLDTVAGMDPLNQISYLEARTYMGNMLLRDSDQMSMAHSLELRVPFLDQILTCWVLRAPASQKGFGRASKLWLRDAFASRLPEEVFTRRKMGFTLPFAVWLRGPLRRELEATLRRNPAGLWDPQTAWAVWQNFLAGRLDWSRPWALYVLSRWAAENIEQEPAPRQELRQPEPA